MPAAGGGAPSIVRGKTARTLLKLKWDYPVFKEAEVKSEGTVAKKARHALTQEEALAYIAGGDHRPLLVLRECFRCNGTDDALLSRGVDNEKTFLLSSWFHCVKLPPDVLDVNHPFHSLFAGEDPEHMFMSSYDGSDRLPLESERSRTELWGHMVKVLTSQYRKDPSVSVKEITQTLDLLDKHDLRVAELESKIGELLESDGPESKKLPKVRADLIDAQQELQTVLAKIEKHSKLELKSASAPARGPAEKKT